MLNIRSFMIITPMCTFSLTRRRPLPSNREHLSSGACLEDKREDSQNWSVLCCVRQLYSNCVLGLDFFFVYLFRFCLLCSFTLA